MYHFVGRINDGLVASTLYSRMVFYPCEGSVERELGESLCEVGWVRT